MQEFNTKQFCIGSSNTNLMLEQQETIVSREQPRRIANNASFC